MIEKTWLDAIEQSSKMYQALQDAWASQNETVISKALKDYADAEDAREIAEVNAGHHPAFPPRTAIGRAKYGLTEKEVEDLIIKIATR